MKAVFVDSASRSIAAKKRNIFIIIDPRVGSSFFPEAASEEETGMCL